MKTLNALRLVFMLITIPSLLILVLLCSMITFPVNDWFRPVIAGVALLEAMYLVYLTLEDFKE